MSELQIPTPDAIGRYHCQDFKLCFTELYYVQISKENGLQNTPCCISFCEF